MLEYKILQYQKKTVYFDEEKIDRHGKKTVKHMQRNETDEEFFERMSKDLSGFSAEGWTVVTMNNVMPSYDARGFGIIEYGEYFSFLLSREIK